MLLDSVLTPHLFGVRWCQGNSDFCPPSLGVSALVLCHPLTCRVIPVPVTGIKHLYYFIPSSLFAAVAGQSLYPASFHHTGYIYISTPSFRCYIYIYISVSFRLSVHHSLVFVSFRLLQRSRGTSGQLVADPATTPRLRALPAPRHSEVPRDLLDALLPP